MTKKEAEIIIKELAEEKIISTTEVIKRIKAGAILIDDYKTLHILRKIEASMKGQEKK